MSKHEIHPDAQRDMEWSAVRNRREQLIKATDWTVLPDSPLSVEVQSKFISYRQELRDIPQVIDDPFAVVWPTKPDIKEITK